MPALIILELELLTFARAVGAFSSSVSMLIGTVRRLGWGSYCKVYH